MQAIRKSLNASGKKEPREILFQTISMADQDQKKRKRRYGQQRFSSSQLNQNQEFLLFN